MTFKAAIAETIWDAKYRFKRFDGTPVDIVVEDTWRRIARALAAKESDSAHWEKEFYDVLKDFKFLPGGRVTAGAGTGRDVTMFNCFVMGTIPDSMDGIFENLKEAALTMQQGGGIGYDFSTIRPSGAEVRGVESNASGPLSFMDVWDSMCRTIMSAGSRRGAMMATMRCDHPDIEAFIEAKRYPARLRMFNLSVLVTDAFMEAVKNDTLWVLKFKNKTYKTVQARDLWDRIMRNTYDYAEPGVIFIDRINRENNLRYCEVISSTNPCGEQPLPPYGACLLGSINLPKFVLNAFGTSCKIDSKALDAAVRVAVRLLDNVIDNSRFPLDEQLLEAKRKRRIGLGVTGLADALTMLNLRYGSDAAVDFTARLMEEIATSAYWASWEIAKEKGAFPAFEVDKFLENGTFASKLPDDLKTAIQEYGIRNSHLLSIAPTGTISLYAGNVSSGIEPIFDFAYWRKVLQPDGSRVESKVEDYAVAAWHDQGGGASFGELPDYFVTAQTLTPHEHLRMQAAAQRWVDSSISKTINLPKDISFDDFKSVYLEAYRLGCKGCTTYRPNDVTGSILTTEAPSQEAPVPVQEAPPRSRPQMLRGATYKMKWPGLRHAVYVTINNDEDGKPFEIFFTSVGTEHSAWMTALGRTISAVFRRGGNIEFVAEELKEIVDPKGGAYLEGQFVPSLVANIGRIIEKHCRKPDWNATPVDVQDEEILEVAAVPKNQCPSCGQYAMVTQSGCKTCTNCGESKCG